MYNTECGLRMHKRHDAGILCTSLNVYRITVYDNVLVQKGAPYHKDIANSIVSFI